MSESVYLDDRLGQYIDDLEAERSKVSLLQGEYAELRGKLAATEYRLSEAQGELELLRPVVRSFESVFCCAFDSAGIDQVSETIERAIAVADDWRKRSQPLKAWGGAAHHLEALAVWLEEHDS